MSTLDILTPVNYRTNMHIVGVIEIVAGILIVVALALAQLAEAPSRRSQS